MKIMTASAALLAALPIAACAPMSERQRDIQNYDRLDFEARFLDFSRRCKASGGVIVIERRGRLGKRGIPRRTDSYRCL